MMSFYNMSDLVDYEDWLRGPLVASLCTRAPTDICQLRGIFNLAVGAYVSWFFCRTVSNATLGDATLVF